MSDTPARITQSPGWKQFWDVVFPLLLFPLVTLALYWAVMQDAPRGDHVILWEIYRGFDWSWREPEKILFVSFLDRPRFQPLMFLLHFVQAKVFGQAFWLYHLVNIVLHALNAFLLFRIARVLHQDWLLSFVVALLFLTAFANLDLVAWSFHYYILLQVSLALFSLYLLVRRDGISWLLVWAYGLSLVQIYLYEPGIVVPALLFLADALRRFGRPGWVLRLGVSLLLAGSVTAIYLASFLAFFSSAGTALPAEDPRALIDFANILRAFTSPVLLLLDSALLQNLFSTPKFLVDELFFLAPPRVDRFVFARSLTNTMVVGACGLLALAFLARLRTQVPDEVPAPPESEIQIEAVPESDLPATEAAIPESAIAETATTETPSPGTATAETPTPETVTTETATLETATLETATAADGPQPDDRRLRAYAVATLAVGLAGFAFILLGLRWQAGASVFQAFFVVWLPVGALAALTIHAPPRAVGLAGWVAARWSARADPIFLGAILLLALVLLFLAPRGEVAEFADDGARLLLDHWDFAAVLFASALLLAGERPRGRRLLWVLFILAVVLVYSGIIGLGRPVSYLVSQSRYAYLPALGLAAIALLLFAPVLARQPAGPRLAGGLRFARKFVVVAGMILFISLNGLKILEALDQLMVYRAETNHVVRETRKFLDKAGQSGDRLFIAHSSYPDHERLAWGSDILPRILYAGDERVTQNLQLATHRLDPEGPPVAVSNAERERGADSFVLRFGFIAVVEYAGAATLEIFTPVGGCAAAGRYLDFAFDETQPALEERQLGNGRVVFGRCAGGIKTVLFKSKPMMVVFNGMNLFEFGRAADSYYLIHNGVLTEKLPTTDPIDLEEMAFELGAVYKAITKVYLTHTFIGVGHRQRDLGEAEIGERFADPPYHPYGFRTYARTLI